MLEKDVEIWYLGAQFSGVDMKRNFLKADQESHGLGAMFTGGISEAMKVFEKSYSSQVVFLPLNYLDAFRGTTECLDRLEVLSSITGYICHGIFRKRELDANPV